MKGLKGTWDSNSESKEEVDMAHVCFMADENTPKVTSESHLDEYELSMDELCEAFEELSNNYDLFKKKYLKIKRENKLLPNQIVVLFKEKEVLSFTLQNTQKDFDAHKVSCKAKFSMIE